MLTEKHLFDVYVLQDICEDHEDIELKLNWETLKNRKEKQDFFHYENERLVGFLGVYKFGNEYEICGMVHPDYRRKGIFTSLLNEAKEVIPSEEVILMNAPAQSKSAKAWLETNNCHYSFSEHQMQWKKRELEIDHPEVQLRPASEEDIPFLVLVDQMSFGIAEPPNELSEDKQAYVIEVQNEAIGKILLERSVEQSWIYGFAILPQYQGKGYGRAALTKIVLTESQSNPNIFLDVETENNNALKLYEECGFVSFHTQDYYRLNR